MYLCLLILKWQVISFLLPLPLPYEAVLYLWHHSSPFTELGPILLQRQGSFPRLSRPGVKVESHTTQLGGNCVPGRGLLWDSIMSLHPSSLLHLCNWVCPCLISMLFFKITSVIQAQEPPRPFKQPGIFGQLSEAKCGKTQHHLKVTVPLTSCIYGRMTLHLSFSIPGCCKITGQKNFRARRVCVVRGGLVISPAPSFWEKRKISSAPWNMAAGV